MKYANLIVWSLIGMMSASDAHAVDTEKKVPLVTVTKASPPAPVSAPVPLRCYTPQQYRAEQAIRYHSQLMVAGMLCQRVAGSQVYSQYQGFTLRNQNVITRAENKLIEFFKDQRKPAPERELHSLRTNLANEISMRAMQQQLDRYCQVAVPRVKEAATMQPRQFENYLVKLDLRQTSTVPLCNQKAVVVPINATIPAQERVMEKIDAKPKSAPVKTVPAKLVTPIKPVEKKQEKAPSQAQ